MEKKEEKGTLSFCCTKKRETTISPHYIPLCGGFLLPQKHTTQKKSALLLLSLSKSSFSFSFSFSSSFVCVCERVKKQRREEGHVRGESSFFSSLGSIPKGERRERHTFFVIKTLRVIIQKNNIVS